MLVVQQVDGGVRGVEQPSLGPETGDDLAAVVAAEREGGVDRPDAVGAACVPHHTKRPTNTDQAAKK